MLWLLEAFIATYPGHAWLELARVPCWQSEGSPPPWSLSSWPCCRPFQLCVQPFQPVIAEVCSKSVIVCSFAGSYVAGPESPPPYLSDILDLVLDVAVLCFGLLI